jgi:hypothetical protein
MSLRNPNLTLYGTSYPNNVYDISESTRRDVEPVNGTTDVKIFVRVYTDETKTYCYTEHEFTLTGLPKDSSQLTPALYQSELLSQRGSEIVDGTQLSNFTVI